MDFSPLPIEDGFSADRLFSQGYSYTYDDVIFLPHYIDFPTDAVSLSTRLTRNIDLSLPCVASPMDTVTEDYMAAAMAALGGIGIVHSNCTAADQARLVVSAKSRRVPIFSSSLDVFKAPDGFINDANDFDGSNYVFVTESGNWNIENYVLLVKQRKKNSSFVFIFYFFLGAFVDVGMTWDCV